MADVIGVIITYPNQTQDILIIENRDWLSTASYTQLTQDIVSAYGISEDIFRSKLLSIIETNPVAVTYSHKIAEQCSLICQCLFRYISVPSVFCLLSPMESWLTLQHQKEPQQFQWLNKNIKNRLSRGHILSSMGIELNKQHFEAAHNGIKDQAIWNHCLNYQIPLINKD